MVGGVSREAYYIIGAYKESLLVLDPHTVNNYQDSSEKIPNNTYLPHKEARLVKFSKFNYNVNIGFIVKSYKDIIQLQKLFKELKTKYKEDFYFSIIEDEQESPIEPNLEQVEPMDSFLLDNLERSRGMSFDIVNDSTENQMEGASNSSNSFIDSSFVYIGESKVKTDSKHQNK